jgi:hypothetical protein
MTQALPKVWGCGGRQGMTGRVFGWLGIKDGVGLVETGVDGASPQRRRDGDRPPRRSGRHCGSGLDPGKQLVALVQREIVTAQSRDHAVRRPLCRSCGAACQVKDYRPHQIATLFGQVTLRLPRFRCAGCGGAEAGHGWPSRCRSTPELDQVRAQFSALMPYRGAAGVLEHLLPIDAGSDPETLRQRVAWRRKRQRRPQSPLLIRRRGRSSGIQDRAFG